MANVAFAASGGDGHYNFQWSNNLSGPGNSILIGGDTTFTVILSDGCASPPVQTVITITAVYPPNVVLNLPVQSGCEPFEAHFAVPTGWPSGYGYLWNFGDGYTSSLPSPTHVYMQDGLYDVSLMVSYTTASTCSTLLDFPEAVDVKAVPVARFISDPQQPTLNHPDVFFTDRSTDASDWIWNFGDGSPENREQNPRHAYADTGSYLVTLKVESNEGCEDSTYQVITVKDELQFFIPNAFTPNASGTNDYFQVYGVGFVSYELFIYDRWGKLVHSGKNREQAWDGTDDTTGEQVPQGLYVYKVTIIDNAGNLHNRFNHVTVIR
jgi:gliding motility-associated-like protein